MRSCLPEDLQSVRVVLGADWIHNESLPATEALQAKGCADSKAGLDGNDRCARCTASHTLHATLPPASAREAVAATIAAKLGTCTVQRLPASVKTPVMTTAMATSMPAEV